MANVTRYKTSKGEARYRVRYRKPDGTQTDKRGFKRKIDAENWAAEHVTIGSSESCMSSGCRKNGRFGRKPHGSTPPTHGGSTARSVGPIVESAGGFLHFAIYEILVILNMST